MMPREPTATDSPDLGLRHLTAGELEALLAGELPAPAPAVRLLAHLCRLCPPCAAAIGAFAAETGETGPGLLHRLWTRDRADYRPSFARALRSLQSRWTVASETAPEESARAQELLELPLTEALERVGADPRYASLAVWEALVQARGREPARGTGDDPALPLIAGVARRLDPALHGRGLVRDCQALTFLTFADAALGRQDLMQVRAHLDAARRLAEDGTGDPMLTRSLHLLGAACARRQGRSRRWLSELDQALDLAVEVRDPQLEAEVHLHRGLALEALGRRRKARTSLSLGLLVFDPARNPDLVAEARAVLEGLADRPQTTDPETPATVPGSHGRAGDED